jgi:hypothetical protein
MQRRSDESPLKTLRTLREQTCMRECVASRVRCFASALLRECVASRVRCFASALLRECVAARVRCFASALLRECVATPVNDFYTKDFQRHTSLSCSIQLSTAWDICSATVLARLLGKTAYTTRSRLRLMLFSRRPSPRLLLQVPCRRRRRWSSPTCNMPGFLDRLRALLPTNKLPPPPFLRGFSTTSQRHSPLAGLLAVHAH